MVLQLCLLFIVYNTLFSVFTGHMNYTYRYVFTKLVICKSIDIEWQNRILVITIFEHKVFIWVLWFTKSYQIDTKIVNIIKIKIYLRAKCVKFNIHKWNEYVSNV